jgi:biopolymer transport protein ExbB
MHILFAQAAEAEPAARTLFQELMNSGVMKYMIDGGEFMWPILAMAIIAVGVVIERLRALSRLTADCTALRHQVLSLMKSDRADEALTLCMRTPGPLAAVLAAGLHRYLVLRRLDADPASIPEQVDKAMDDSGPHVAAVLEKHLPILGTISAVAPMVGSVGTVVGMVILFDHIAQKVGTVNIIVAAAAGIKVKLLVTVWGLMVGIPAYVAYNYFSTRINNYMLEIEQSASMFSEAVTVRAELLKRAQAAESAGELQAAAIRAE